MKVPLGISGQSAQYDYRNVDLETVSNELALLQLGNFEPLKIHIDINKCPYAGNIFSFAGLNPKRKWEKGERRPWNADLKKIIWKIIKLYIRLIIMVYY